MTVAATVPSRLADSLAARHAAVRAVHHAQNRGFSGAMITCFRQARGDWVFLAPADGQTRIAELPRFLAATGGADVVVGVRKGRPDGIARKLLSRSFHAIARALFELPQREFSSVFLFRRSLLDAMPFRSAPRSASLLPEILYRANARGARLIELEVAQWPRLFRPRQGRPALRRRADAGRTRARGGARAHGGVAARTSRREDREENRLSALGPATAIRSGAYPASRDRANGQGRALKSRCPPRGREESDGAGRNMLD